jgi:predicted DCC family thiol-disulfide oxidoreductase YuxK
MAPEQAEATVYFDGSCPLCRTEIAYYRGQDAACRLKFVDVSQNGAPTPPGTTQIAAMQRFHVERADGSVVSGAAAFAVIWDLLPRWRWAARLAALPGVTLMLECVYRAFLPIRRFVSRAVGQILRARSRNQPEVRP